MNIISSIAPEIRDIHGNATVKANSVAFITVESNVLVSKKLIFLAFQIWEAWDSQSAGTY